MQYSQAERLAMHEAELKCTGIDTTNLEPPDGGKKLG